MTQMRKLRVGFDLDGVILYNPARILRPVLHPLLTRSFGKKNLHFYKPQNKLSRFFWKLAHKSSLFPARGFTQLCRLIEDGDIEAYIISGRYRMLEDDFTSWTKKLNDHNSFSGIFFDEDDLEPHVFKRKMINQLKLDVFVEDNWDIVQSLQDMTGKNIEVLWISNVLDSAIGYRRKFFSLRSVVEYLKTKVK